MAEDKNPGLEPLLKDHNARGKTLTLTNDDLVELMSMNDIYNKNEANLKLVKHGYVNGVARNLGSSVKDGIIGDERDVAERRQRYGDNKPKPRKTKTICGIICEQLKDMFVILLGIAAVVSLTVGVIESGWKEGWLDGVSILVAILIITGVNTINEAAKEKQF